MKVSAQAARWFLIARHLLNPARSTPGGPDGVVEVFRRLGSIQFDPIAVAGRSHDLVLHSRVADYEPGWCDLLYARGDIFETTNKALSLIPTAEMAWYRWGIGRKGPGFHANILASNSDVADRILERIRAEGPLAVHDFQPEQGTATDWFGMPENTVRAVLESYTVAGTLGLARREGHRRYYDLVERLLPVDVLASAVPIREQLRHRLLSRYRAHGLLGTTGPAFDRIASPNSTPEWPGRNELRQELIDAGQLVPVDIEGIRGRRYVLADEAALLQTPPEPTPSVVFLSPFDSLLWDTPFLAALFDFEQVWEGFFPPAKRRWGRYVLPVVFGDHFVGRIEPRIDRERSCVEILGLWWEQRFTPGLVDGFVGAARQALTDYLRFADAGRLEWAPQLNAEKRLLTVRR